MLLTDIRVRVRVRVRVRFGIVLVTDIVTHESISVGRSVKVTVLAFRDLSSLIRMSSVIRRETRLANEGS